MKSEMWGACGEQPGQSSRESQSGAGVGSPQETTYETPGPWPATGTLFPRFGKLSRRPGTPLIFEISPHLSPSWCSLLWPHQRPLDATQFSPSIPLCPFPSPLPLCRAAGVSIANTCSFDAVYQTHRGRLSHVLNSNFVGITFAAHISGDLWVLKVIGWNPRKP